MELKTRLLIANRIGYLKERDRQAVLSVTPGVGRKLAVLTSALRKKLASPLTSETAIIFQPAVTVTLRRNSAFVSGSVPLMYMPEPSSKPATRVSRGIRLIYQW